MSLDEMIYELQRLLWHWDDLESGKRIFRGYDREAVAIALVLLTSGWGAEPEIQGDRTRPWVKGFALQ